MKPALSGHSKIDKTKILKTNDSLMKVESIAECSPWSILQYFWPALSDNWSWKPNFGLFFEWPLKTGFTVFDRWKDEHERLRNQLLNKDRQMDEERSELMTANYKKLEESQREKAEEIERLKDIHR